MSKNPYELLGLDENATTEQIDAAYYALRDEYRQGMYQEGALGNAAAQKLNDLEEAYRAISAERFATGGAPKQQSQPQENASAPSGVSPEYAEVDRLLKAGDYKGAQQALDAVDRRGAEWHYFQSVIYYKKGWLNESRNQLQLAINMDPDNERYRTVMGKLNAKIEAGTTRQNRPQNYDPNQQGEQNDGAYRSYQDQADARYAEDTACACCEGLLCANCLCNCCMR